MDDIKILIIEDEILIADYIKDILKSNGYDNVIMAHGVKEAQQEIEFSQPDIIFMDINIEGNYEGIELSKKKNKNASLIFITGQADSKTIENALSVSPDSYLTKPIREIELLTSLKITINKRQKTYIFIKDGYDEVKLMFDDIIYIQADKNYLDITTKNSTITIRHSLKDFLTELPLYFKQIQRSVVINSNWIEKISSEEVIVKGFILPLSRNFKNNL